LRSASARRSAAATRSPPRACSVAASGA
jgi:hypothetical protein